MPSTEPATFDAGGNHDQVRPRHGQTWVSGGLDDAREICRRFGRSAIEARVDAGVKRAK
jgi:hypothetical protein